MAALRQLCDSNNINLIVLVTPLYEKTYKKAVDNGYLQFLQDLSAEIEFYCFSGINAYTTDAEYYFDPSHFRPYVGLEMEKIVFGSDDEKNQATQKAKSDKSMVEFGKYVNGENVNEVIEGLSREFTE
jgi:hypothetical protein